MTNPSRVAVIGAGPGGLMAADVLQRRGLAVTVFDRMPSAGRKLLLAGRGGLNLTHSEPIDTLLDHYGAARPRLEDAIRAFPPDALRAWCAGLGQPTFVGSSGRVFPEAFRATPLLRAWLRDLTARGVEFRMRHTWHGWSDGGALRFTDATGGELLVSPDATVLALGGASWPRTGSDGAWVGPVARAGIRVEHLRPANCGFEVVWSPRFAERFAGVPLKNIRLTAPDGSSVRAEAMITTAGIEGGAVYALAATLRDAIAVEGGATLTVDLHPDVSVSALSERLDRRRAGDSASTFLKRAGGLSPVEIALLREDERGATSLPLDDSPALAERIKNTRLRLTATRPIERAISSAGGVALDEIDGDWMLTRRPGVFVVGEMADWEAPTGGYLLQATFSIAVAAATGVTRYLGGS